MSVSKRKAAISITGSIVCTCFVLFILSEYIIGTRETTSYQLLHDKYGRSLDPKKLKVFSPKLNNALKELQVQQEVNYTKFAYVNYVATERYLCNTFVQFKSLLQLGTQAKLVLLITPWFKSNSLLDEIKSLAPEQVIVKNVKTRMIPGDISPWMDSLVKLEIFNLEEYDRIIYLDNDGLIQHNMDELFFLPQSIEFAAPIKHWETDVTFPIAKESTREQILEGYSASLVAPELIAQNCDVGFNVTDSFCDLTWTSMMMVIKPSTQLFEAITSLTDGSLGKYDMEYINQHYQVEDVLRNQQKRYQLNPLEYEPHVAVLSLDYGIISNQILDDSLIRNSPNISFESIIINSKYIHFSDYSVGKPMDFSDSSEMSCPSDSDNCSLWSNLYGRYFQLAKFCYIDQE